MIVQPQAAHTLKGGNTGWCGSEDGTGRGAPIVAYGESGQGYWQEGIRPLRAEGENRPSRPSNVVAFTQNTRDEVRLIGGDGSRAGALPAQPGMKQQSYVCAFAERSRDGGRNFEAQEDLAYALANPGSGGTQHSRRIAGAFGIRRLTPRECERLQGFPDDWTRLGVLSDSGDQERDKEWCEQSDSARYRMLGNAVAVPVAEWIGRRIAEVERHAQAER